MRIPWTRREQRWRDALCSACIPSSDLGRLPGFASVAAEEFWREVDAAAPPLLRVGLRGAVLGLALCPPVVIGRLATFDTLSAADQERVLTRVADSRWFLVRQLPVTIKLFTCFAYLREGAIRDRLDPEVRS